LFFELAISSSKGQQKNIIVYFNIVTVFTRISAATLIKFLAPQMQRLFEGGAHLRAALIENWTQQRNLFF